MIVICGTLDSHVDSGSAEQPAMLNSLYDASASSGAVQPTTIKRKPTAHEGVAAEPHEARDAGGGWVRLTEAQHALVMYDYTPGNQQPRGYIIAVVLMDHVRCSCMRDKRTYY